MAHRVLSHTADTGIEATARSLAALINELAEGMFSLMTRRSTEIERWIEVNIEAASLEDLVVDTLSELLWMSETEDLAFGEFRVTTTTDPQGATVEAGGVPTGKVDEVGPPIKAVTYHQLVVEESDDGWYGRVYFDV